MQGVWMGAVDLPVFRKPRSFLKTPQFSISTSERLDYVVLANCTHGSSPLPHAILR